MLRTVELAESDLVVHLLTQENARLSAIAKGARRSRRRFPGALDLFQRVRIHAERRGAARMARLEQAVLVDSFPALRAHPVRFALACTLVELLGRLAPEGAARADARRLFDFAVTALSGLEHATPDLRLRSWLELRTLDALGLRPELRRCVRCGVEVKGEPRVGFHVAEGGPICAACALRIDGLLPVHVGTLRALEQVLRFDATQLARLAMSPAALDEARRLLLRCTRFHLGVELRSERFVDEIMRVGPPAAA